MNLATAKVVCDILVAMKINRIQDKDAKLALTKDFVAVRKAVKAVDDDRMEISDKFRSDWADELQNETKSVAYLEAENEANEAVRALYFADAEIEVEKVKADTLFDPELWGADDTLGQIANSVDFLVRAGLAE